jgi:hypothetical protein
LFLPFTGLDWTSESHFSDEEKPMEKPYGKTSFRCCPYTTNPVSYIWDKPQVREESDQQQAWRMKNHEQKPSTVGLTTKQR